jgi:hypothetical protein
MKKTLLLIALFVAGNLISQTKNNDVTATFLENNPYFNDNQEELFFLHTNKTVYFSGEKIWFSGYILDKLSEKPSTITKNLHINLYDPNFKLVDQKLYHVEEGKTQGQFKLLENLVSGAYYLEVDTNWNKNFKKGTIVKIEVINLKKPQVTIGNTKNSINKNANLVTTKKYNFSIIRDRKKTNSAIFKFRTIKSIVEKHQGTTLFAVLHKNGAFRSLAPINIDNKKNYTIKFDANLFFNGANTITLFDKNNIVLAENSFWNFDTKTGSLEISRLKKERDTLYLNLKLPQLARDSNVSISIVDGDSKLITKDNNIFTSLLDKDYESIKSLDKNSKIDNFLSKRITSDLFSDLNKSKNKIIYKNETGIKIKGTVTTKSKKTNGFKIVLTSKKNGLFIVEKLNKTMSFEFDNLLLKHPSTYELSLLNKKGKVENSKFYVYNKFYNYKAESNLLIPKNISFKKSDVTNELKNNVLFEEDEEFEELEEVIIKSYSDKQKDIREKYKNIVGINFKSLYIPENDPLALGTDIFFYLGNIPGVRVNYRPLSNVPLVFNTRGQKTITGGRLVNVQLNGVPLGGDLSPLTGMLTTDFEVIIVNLSGAGEGIRGVNGVINLIEKTSYTSLRKDKTKKTIKRTTTKGFENSLDNYVKPRIEFGDINLEKAYGTIHWVPNLKIDTNTSTILKIPVSKKHENIKLIVNGFDKNGILIHNTLTIPNK